MSTRRFAPDYLNVPMTLVGGLFAVLVIIGSVSGLLGDLTTSAIGDGVGGVFFLLLPYIMSIHSEFGNSGSEDQGPDGPDLAGPGPEGGPAGVGFQPKCTTRPEDRSPAPPGAPGTGRRSARRAGRVFVRQ